MPCLLGLLALALPRVALFLVWFFGDGYLTRAFGSFLWVLLGFLFLPLTTLTFAYAHNSLGAPGVVTPLGWLLTGIAFFIDIGLFRGGNSQYRR
ncbi:MAG TPA: hypothetical protein VIM73_17505, partial [Polyangiaceae bacterium]